jgi:hypothetical protein
MPSAELAKGGEWLSPVMENRILGLAGSLALPFYVFLRI